MKDSTIIVSDEPLTESLRRTLDAVLEVIIPANPARAMPSAREVAVFRYLQDHAADYWPLLSVQLDELDTSALRQFAHHFADLSLDERMRVAQALRTADPGFLRRLALETVTCYYQDDRVMVAIGLEARPPAPKGQEAYAGDFSLVEPVIARGESWRRTQ